MTNKQQLDPRTTRVKDKPLWKEYKNVHKKAKRRGRGGKKIENLHKGIDKYYRKKSIYIQNEIRTVDNLQENNGLKYKEDKILELALEHIIKTYGSHYARGEFQTLDGIMAESTSIDFPMGNAKKYLSRYGKKKATIKRIC